MDRTDCHHLLDDLPGALDCRRHNAALAETTAVFVLRREPDTRKREASVVTYLSLVHEPHTESKRLTFEKALAKLKQVQEVA
jgi:hypothetical protein